MWQQQLLLVLHRKDQQRCLVQPLSAHTYLVHLQPLQLLWSSLPQVAQQLIYVSSTQTNLRHALAPLPPSLQCTLIKAPPPGHTLYTCSLCSSCSPPWPRWPSRFVHVACHLDALSTLHNLLSPPPPPHPDAHLVHLQPLQLLWPSLP
jgi:hypothetical protein